MSTRQTRVLVAAATRLGSTTEVASFIAEALSGAGADVDLLAFDRIADVGGYDLVIVGSPIRYDRWLPEATAFVRTHRDQLARTRTALFFTCLTLSKPTDKSLATAAGYAAKLQALVPDASALTVQGFAGVLDYSRMNWAIRLLMRIIARAQGVDEGDYRDWESIRAWSQGLLPGTRPDQG